MGLSNLDKYEEKALLRELALFPNSLVNASLQFKPNLLTQYLEKVSSRFHHFYNSLSVLNADNYDLMQARLNLCEATKIVLNRGLSILGVSAPESM